MSYLLSISIPTICSRLKEFTDLSMAIKKQIVDNKLEDKVCIQFCRDNKEMTIGAKRQKLYNESEGLYTVQVDDDDWLVDDYCPIIVEHIEKYGSIDCFGYIESIGNNPMNPGKPTVAYHKNEYNDWWYQNGVYGRTPYFKDVIKTEICKKVLIVTEGLKARIGEDHQFARDLKKSGLIKSFMFINRPMYIYDYKYEETNTKYGIK